PVRTPANSWTTTSSVLIIFSSASNKMSSTGIIRRGYQGDLRLYRPKVGEKTRLRRLRARCRIALDDGPAFRRGGTIRTDSSAGRAAGGPWRRFGSLVHPNRRAQ